jgi:peroxiredoxin
MKIISFTIVMCALMLSCGGGGGYRIDGKVANLEDGLIYAVFESEDLSVADTVTCDKPGEFRIERSEGEFNQVTLMFEDRSVWFTAYLDAGDRIKITGDMKHPTLMQARGGRINDELSEVCRSLAPLLTEREDLLKIQDNGRPEHGDVMSRLANVNHQLVEQAVDYIHDNPGEKASVVLIKTFIADPDDTRRLDELLITLSPELKDFYLTRELEEYSLRAKRTALGAEAPNFEVKNIYGRTVSLDSFPERYILLTFTAPWCDMCRADELYLDEIDRTYTGEQLEQLLVSLDDDMQGLKEVMKRESIKWNLVTDSAGQATMLFDLYNVSALPRCYLIDEEGRIILKTDNGAEIKQTLETLMKD